MVCFACRILFCLLPVCCLFYPFLHVNSLLLNAISLLIYIYVYGLFIFFIRSCILIENYLIDFQSLT